MSTPQHSGNWSSFSICIPTYNRAGLLQRCLSHLLNYSDRSFELIIGDNHSSDETPRVIASFEGKFMQLTVLRHAANIGFSRNMDAILRRATREYIYVLSDDDFLFEGALAVVKDLMESRPQLAAVIGQYLSVNRLVDDAVIDYRTGSAQIVPAKAYEVLLDNRVACCDGHPFMRRELFQRHCAYWDRSIGLIPLYMKLLEYGELAVVEKPFFQHLENGNSLSASMMEAWMLDMWSAEFELAIASPETRHLRHKLDATRQRFLQNYYLQAARMSRNKGLTYLLWMFLRRLESVQGGGDDFMVKAESAFMHDFLVDRVSRIVCDAGFSNLIYDQVPVCEALVRSLADKGFPGGSHIDFYPYRPDTIAPTNVVRLREKPAATHFSEPVVVIEDQFEQLRLSRFGGHVAAFNDRLIVHYQDPATAHLLELPNTAFQWLLVPYEAAI